MKIAIVVDSSIGLTKEEVNKKGWFFLPLYIQHVEKSYKDGVDINSQTYNALISNDNAKLTTSTTPIGEALKLIQKLSISHDKVIIFPIAQGLSSQYANLATISKEFRNVDVVPSKDILEMCNFKLQLFEKAFKLGQITYNQGLDFLASQPEDTRIFLVPKSLDALVRGGRLSKSAAKLANLASIVPIINFQDGKLEKGGKGRNFRKTFLKRIAKLVKGIEKEKNDFNFYILDFHNDEVNNLKMEIEKEHNIKVAKTNIAPVIGAHVGTGTIAFIICRKVREIKPNVINLKI